MKMNVCNIVKSSVNILCQKNCLFPHLSFCRNTWIVKRKFPPPLSKLTAVRPRILKGRHFVYETIEDTDLTEPPDIHVVLTTFVEGIGDVGDVISVVPHYARDYLLLPKKAAYATTENIEKYGLLKKTRKERPEYSSIHAATIIRCLSKIVVPVFMNKENAWTVTKNHIHIAFRTEGYYVPLDAIELPSSLIEGPDSAKEGADFAVTVTINNTEKVLVRCRIFHINPGFEAASLTEDFYLEKASPILAEQKDILEKMPMPEILDDPSSSVSLIEKYRIQYIH